jgi:uncharacterized protein (TIGR02453 family)
MFEKSFYFLQQLKKNNNRDWYHANKSLYSAAKEEFDQITEILIHAINEFDKSIAGLTPKDCVFRIFRDIRFSNDKTPYKINFGSYIVKGGKKSAHAGYYLHIEPGGSFVAGGIYMPPAPWLKAIRQNIYEHIDEFNEILETPELKRKFGEISGEKLKKAPQGFPAEFAAIELLKFKSYDLIRMMADKEFQKENILKEITSLFRIMHPFIRFLNEAEEYMND